MRSRALFAGVVLSCAIVSGGWLVTRGLVGTRSARSNNAQMFGQVYERVSHLYVDTLADSTLVTRTIDGLVSELHDPHSSYLSPQLLARLSERTSGRYAGVGAQVDIRDGWITIVAPLPGGPAIEAGVQAGDRILMVDGKPMRGVPLDEAQKALRGIPGSKVRLSVERPGVTMPIEFVLARREIHVRPVQHAMLFPNGVGYVALTIFSQESAPDLKAAIDSLRGAGMTSLIFDLRGDPGGLLDQGVGVADLFLDPGQSVVSMKGRTPAISRAFSDDAPQPWPKMPLAVLVDSNSASASEIVAGALQDHDRALLLGTTTYGKGSAQNVFPLSNGGAVKLTTALWFTPSGRSINRGRDTTSATGVAVRPDSTKPRPTYKTDAGRTVLGGGGITPDVILPVAAQAASDTAFQHMLGTQVPKFRDALTDYALSLKGSHAVASPDFVVTPEMRNEVKRRMEARGIRVDQATYDAARDLVDRLLGYEIARYSFGEQGEWARRLRDDPAVQATRAIVSGTRTQAELLARGAAAKPGGR
jgi:carboxyl-terminal processing protease